MCSVCIFFFSFGHTDGKCMTHRTSVWLPERVGLGSALSEARRGPWAWSQWVTNPLAANVITCDWETPLSKSTTSPPLSSSSSNKGRQRVKQHIAFLSAERTGHMWKEEKKKATVRCLQSQRCCPDCFNDWVQICLAQNAFKGYWTASSVLFIMSLCHGDSILRAACGQVIIEEGMWLLFFVSCAAVKLSRGQDEGTSSPLSSNSGFTLCCCSFNHILLWRMHTADTGAPIKAVEVARRLAQSATHVEF